MKKPVLDGELAPNVAIQKREEIRQTQYVVDEVGAELKQVFVAEKYQEYYAWIGALIDKMLSLRVLKNVESVADEYDGVENLVGGEAKIESYTELKKIYRKLILILRDSPIYEFEYTEEEVYEVV